jgi:hypothetical protein
MTAQEVLIRALERQLDSFLMTTKKVPVDKIDWVPQEGLRSALDQFREVATIIGSNWVLYSDLKMEYSESQFADWMAERASYTDFESLEARLRKDTTQLIEYARSTTADKLMTEVQMPWPGDFRIVDIIQYHTWNMTYHEGQIMLLLMLMGVESVSSM